MDKISFINELMKISDDIVLLDANFRSAIAYNNQINLFFRAIQFISEAYDARDEIAILPKDFRGEVDNVFYFAFSNKIVTNIPDGECHECELGKFTIHESDSSAGYKCIVDVNNNLFAQNDTMNVVDQLYSNKWIK